MSAIGTKRTCLVAPHMSAFGGKADMPLCTAEMSAFDPKRISYPQSTSVTPDLSCWPIKDRTASATRAENSSWTASLPTGSSRNCTCGKFRNASISAFERRGVAAPYTTRMGLGSATRRAVRNNSRLDIGSRHRLRNETKHVERLSHWSRQVSRLGGADRAKQDRHRHGPWPSCGSSAG